MLELSSSTLWLLLERWRMVSMEYGITNETRGVLNIDLLTCSLLGALVCGFNLSDMRASCYMISSCGKKVVGTGGKRRGT